MCIRVRFKSLPVRVNLLEAALIMIPFNIGIVVFDDTAF
jgi:hypothetical protein